MLKPVYWIAITRIVRAAAVLLVLLGPALCVYAEDGSARPRPSITIPRLQQKPRLEDFLEMKPGAGAGASLARTGEFTQVLPKDGAAPTFRTEAYLGYDDQSLYVVFIAFDSEPEKIRATMTKRDAFALLANDDQLAIRIDTFDDHRHSYHFKVNPYGIQGDGLWADGDGFDGSFDTLWYSRGQVTKEGYVVWVAIPFKSLRFPSTPVQKWGIYLGRSIPRFTEFSAWPRLTTRIQGFLSQTASLEGMENISPGRNVQIIPYGIFRSYHELDRRDASSPGFIDRKAAAQAGVDAKVVFRDSLVFDLTANPDFSQVESDEPQVTVNQRFEVFFPEKRPFFLENADYFQTPINMVFTRRIVKPTFGVRMTGKVGPYALGLLVSDDESPGKIVSSDDRLAGERAYFGVLRVTRDILDQSSLGFTYTRKSLAGSQNHVGGIDARLKLSQTWSAYFQAARSLTTTHGEASLTGSALYADLVRSGRKFTYDLEYNDRSPNFITEVGFDPRIDIRQIDQRVSYRWRPEGNSLIAWGPNFHLSGVWDQEGTRLDQLIQPSITWEFRRQTDVTLSYSFARERLRPKDFPTLSENEDFAPNSVGFHLSSYYSKYVTLQADYHRGAEINFVPRAGQQPVLANSTFGSFGLVVRPLTNMQINNTYLETRLTSRDGGTTIFTNRIIRSRWTWQFNRKLSLRVIPQYSILSTNQQLTSLELTKGFNADVLVSYMVNPWTALYAGYNTNFQNIGLFQTPDGVRIRRSGNGLLNDSRQFFVKFSYLIRF